MNYIKFSILILSSLLAINCSSSDDIQKIEIADLYDEWKISNIIIGDTPKNLSDCEKGEGVVFNENSIAQFIIVDDAGFEENIIQEGFEQCDYRYAEYDLSVDENLKYLYLIVPNEGEEYMVDDYIAQFEIITLNNSNLTIKLIAESSIGKLENFEENKIEIPKNQQEMSFYIRK